MTDRLPPLLLIHGFLGSPHDWRGFDHGTRTTIAVDLAALAMDEVSADPDAGVTLERLASRVLGVASGRGVREVDLLGYSLGGRVALAALAIPEGTRVRRVMLASAHPGIEQGDERDARALRDAALARDLEAIAGEADPVRRADRARAFLGQWYAQDLFAALRRSEGFHSSVERRVAALANGAARAWAAVLRGCSPGTSQPRWDTLARHAQAIHLAVGADDTRYEAVAERARALGVPTTTIDGAGHALPIEAPAALSAAARRFFGMQRIPTPSLATE